MRGNCGDYPYTREVFNTISNMLNSVFKQIWLKGKNRGNVYIYSRVAFTQV